jgi:polysaccharide biosynthesis protein PelF
VPHRDPVAVAAAIKRLSADPPLRARIGNNLREKVIREYSVSAVLPKWEKLLDEICIRQPLTALM